jgi:hypothetical protein
MGKTNADPSLEVAFVPCTLCGNIVSEYVIKIEQIGTGKLLTTLACCAECAEKARA